MKLKLWAFEYAFDRDDAKIVVPIILLVVGVSATSIPSGFLVSVAVAYYALYFFAGSCVEWLKNQVQKMRLRCPRCKNKKIFLQGYQEYKSDEFYAYYFCDRCKTTSVLTDRGLIVAGGK